MSCRLFSMGKNEGLSHLPKASKSREIQSNGCFTKGKGDMRYSKMLAKKTGEKLTIGKFRWFSKNG